MFAYAEARGEIFGCVGRGKRGKGTVVDTILPSGHDALTGKYGVNPGGDSSALDCCVEGRRCQGIAADTS